MKQVLILVEGQTEELFVKNVLSPYLNTFGVHLNPTIINTKLVKGGKNFKGGIDNYGQIKRDIQHLTRNNSLIVTTFSSNNRKGRISGKSFLSRCRI
jgi:hypothetical protein